MPKRTYAGPHPSVSVAFPDGTGIKAERGKAVDVTAAQAKALDATDEWKAPKPKASKPDEAKADETEPAQGEDPSTPEEG